MRGRMAMFHHGMAAAAAALSPPGCPFDSLIPASELLHARLTGLAPACNAAAARQAAPHSHSPCARSSLPLAAEHGQCTAFLAAYWTAGCWLLPTLLLLPKRRPVSSLERCLQALLGRDLKQQQQHAADAAGLEPGGTHRSVLLLRWWMLAVLGWAACCVLLGG